MFTYEHKLVEDVQITRPNFKYYLMMDRQKDGTREGLESAMRYIRQSFYFNNPEFQQIFMKIAAQQINDMEMLAAMIHQMHGEDDRFYDEDNDDTPAFELIPPCDEEKPNTDHHKEKTHINNDITAAVMYDLQCEEKQRKYYEFLYEEMEDEGARICVKHLLESNQSTMNQLKGILNTLSEPNEIKDFGYAGSHNNWDQAGGNYFDKQNPIFINPSEIEKPESK